MYCNALIIKNVYMYSKYDFVSFIFCIHNNYNYVLLIIIINTCLLTRKLN